MTANRTLLLMGASLALSLVFFILREHRGTFCATSPT